MSSGIYWFSRFYSRWLDIRIELPPRTLKLSKKAIVSSSSLCTPWPLDTSLAVWEVAKGSMIQWSWRRREPKKEGAEAAAGVFVPFGVVVRALVLS